MSLNEGFSFDDWKEMSDEQYLVQKAKETALTDVYRSKVWTLTARTLFPENFDIQFEAYLIEKKNGNIKETAKCFSSLFQVFVSENGLWEELNAFTNALRSENPTPEETFLRNVFSSMPYVIQHDILTVTAERSEDTMDYCRLMLLLFKKFPQSTPHLTIRLVDTLVTSEKHGHCASVINCYRRTLVCEVLPLLLNSSAEVPQKQLYRFLHRSIEFYLAYVMAELNAIDNSLERESRSDIVWESLFDLLKTFGTKLDWNLCSIFNAPWNRDLAWQEMYNTVRDGLLDVRQIIYCLTVTFAYNLFQYNITINPLSEDKNPAVMVEAFVMKEKEVTPTLPLKKLKLHVEGASVESSVPYISCGEGIGDVAKNFDYTYNCWNTLNSSEIYLKEFTKLKQHIKLDSWLMDFVTDVALYRNKLDDYQMNIQQNSTYNIRTQLRKLNHNYVIKNYQGMFENSMLIMKSLDTLTAWGNYSSLVTESNVSRHLHFLPIAKLPILQYVVKLLIIFYWQQLPNFSGLDVDRIYGCLLVLCQISWPSEKGIAGEILKSIRLRRSFTFPLFFKYIINLELLEEFTYMYSNEHESVKLDLMGVNHTPSTKRMSTRGANKEERADFRHMMKQQVCRQEPLHTLIIQFLLEEERYLVLKLKI